MSKSLVKRIIGGLLATLLAVGLFFGGFFLAKRIYLTKELESIKFIIDTYRDYYYQEQDNLPHLFADSLMDEYSRFYTKEEYELTQKASEGYRKAMGISINDNLEIVKILYNSPAQKAGMIEGAKITQINGTSVSTRAEFNQLVGEQSTFLVEYKGEQKSFTVRSEEFTETFVKYYDNENEYYFEGEEIEFKQKPTTIGGLDYKTGYLVYRGFSAINSKSPSDWKEDISTSAGQFAKALSVYSQTGKTKLVIDLRNNGGGFMTVLSSVVSHFLLEENALICEARYKGEKVERFYGLEPLRANYTFEKITVLVNEGTASASEAFVGALLDYDSEGVVEVVCEYNSSRGNYSSYGKGIMQSTVINEVTDEAVKLTVAEIFWPISKKSIHTKGISPSVDNRVKPSIKNGQPIDALEYFLNG